MERAGCGNREWQEPVSDDSRLTEQGKLPRARIDATTAPSGRALTGTACAIEDPLAIRQRISPDEWKRIVGTLRGRRRARARNGGSARQFIEAVLWVAQTGANWTDLPKEYGPWHGVYVRFARWSKGGIWIGLIAAMSDEDGRKTDLNNLVGWYLERRNVRELAVTFRRDAKRVMHTRESVWEEGAAYPGD